LGLAIIIAVGLIAGTIVLRLMWMQPEIKAGQTWRFHIDERNPFKKETHKVIVLATKNGYVSFKSNSRLGQERPELFPEDSLSAGTFRQFYTIDSTMSVGDTK